MKVNAGRAGEAADGAALRIDRLVEAGLPVRIKILALDARQAAAGFRVDIWWQHVVFLQLL